MLGRGQVNPPHTHTHTHTTPHRCHTQSFLGIPVDISAMYLSETEGLRLWIRRLSENVLEFRVPRLA